MSLLVERALWEMGDGEGQERRTGDGGGTW